MSKAILKLPMNIESCSKNQQMALRLLRQHADGLKASELLKLMRENVKWNVPAGSIGSLFNRLESFGFVEHSTKLGAAWKLSELGHKLFDNEEYTETYSPISYPSLPSGTIPAVKLKYSGSGKPLPADDMEKENSMKNDANVNSSVIGIINSLSMDESVDTPSDDSLELTLKKLERRLQPIPTESVQTYLRIVRLLPAYLVEILEPITRSISDD